MNAWLELLAHYSHRAGASIGIASSVRFVKRGRRFVAMHDFPAQGLTHWNAPFTGGFNCVVPKGTVFVVDYDSQPGATAFGCVPENAKDFELRFVPEAERTNPKYGGYSLVFFFSVIGEHLAPA